MFILWRQFNVKAPRPTSSMSSTVSHCYGQHQIGNESIQTKYTSAAVKCMYDLVLGAPVAVLGRYLDRAEPVDGDAEDCVDGTETDSVVYGQPQIT